MSLGFAVREVRTDIARDRSLVIAVAVTVAATLVLTGAGLILRMQVESLKASWLSTVQVSVFLCGPTSLEKDCPDGPVTAQQRTAVEQLLSTQPWVKQVTYESQDEAYEVFSSQFQGSPLADSVSPEAMPESFRVALVDPEQFALVGQTVEDLAGVERVNDQRAVLENLFSAASVASLISWTLALVLVAVSSVLVASTVRTAAQNRKRQTQVMRLVGASSSSIRLPFLLEAAAASLAGAALAVPILAAGKVFLLDSALARALPFAPPMPWSQFALVATLLTIAGTALCITAAAAAVRKALRA